MSSSSLVKCTEQSGLGFKSCFDSSTFLQCFFWEIAFEPREEHRQQANVKTILNKATHSIGGYHGLKTFLNFQMLVLAVLIIYLQRRWRVTPFLHQILNRNCCANSYHHWVSSPCIFSTSKCSCCFNHLPPQTTAALSVLNWEMAGNCCLTLIQIAIALHSQLLGWQA